MRVTFLAAIVLLLTAALLIPTAVAQPKPVLRVKLSWAVDHDMIIDETGKGDMGIRVETWGEDFVCPQPFKFKVELHMKDLPKIYGASIIPTIVPAGANYFVFDTGKPGLKPASAGDKSTNSPNEDAKLNMAWDLEGIPKTNARYDYILKGTIKPEGSTQCNPAPNPDVQESKVMTVKMNDRVVENVTAEDKCQENPGLPGCAAATATANEGGNAPGPDVLIILLGLLGFVGIWRRHHK